MTHPEAFIPLPGGGGVLGCVVTLRAKASPLIAELSSLAATAERVAEAVHASPEIIDGILGAGHLLGVFEDEGDIRLTANASDGLLRLELAQGGLEAVAALRALAVDFGGTKIEHHSQLSMGGLSAPMVAEPGRGPQRSCPGEGR